MDVQTAARLEQIDAFRWRVPRRTGMHVPGLVYADSTMAAEIVHDPALDQVANVAALPGIVRASLAMPDIHSGYGFPIGGVAAFRTADGVVVAGGVGYDINCGARIVRTDLAERDVRGAADKLADELARSVPAGLASRRRGARLADEDLDAILRRGAAWAVEKGLGVAEDLELCEERGAMAGADPELVSARAKERGREQMGSLGSGNHFLEVDVVDAVYDLRVADAFGIRVGQVVAFLHTGSRGLGHQVCSDHLAVMLRAAERSGIELPDRQLACAYYDSREAQEYLAAMRAAANFAWANRQVITHSVRCAFRRIFDGVRDLGMTLLYDVAHNIAKVERHAVATELLDVIVHRKGATRAFPAHHPDVPTRYREVGQPVLIPGDMGRYSFLCVGRPGSMSETFGSTCHGAGRRQSRHAALREQRGVDLIGELRSKGITVRVTDRRLLGEEASSAYKDVADVVDVCEGAGLVRKVARMRPMIVVKG